MDLDTNIGARIIGAIICIVIGGISANITIETYNKINDTATFEYLTGIIPPKQSAIAVVQLMMDVEKPEKEIRDFVKWNNKEKGASKIVELFLNHIQSNRHTILYSSVFVFCISLCCFTYICVKK